MTHDHPEAVEYAAAAPELERCAGSTPPFPKWPCETLQSMAEIGEAFMNALPEGYSWCQSPAEVIADLQNKLHDVVVVLAACCVHPDICAKWVHGSSGSVLGDRECTCGLDAALTSAVRP